MTGPRVRPRACSIPGRQRRAPASLLGTGQTSGSVPTGTRISVYTADGNTLLYSYTTTAANTPEVTTSDIFNTGNAPFQRGRCTSTTANPTASAPPCSRTLTTSGRPLIQGESIISR